MRSKCLLMLAASIFMANAAASSSTVDQDGVLRDSQGEVLTMNRADAIKACAEHDMRLPTIRKLLESFSSAGLVVRETRDVTDEDVVKRYVHVVDAINPDEKRDMFYYGYVKYFNPGGALGNNWFWSSSIRWGGSPDGRSDDSYYGLNGVGGYLYADLRPRHRGAVRCISLN